jgi:predicted ATPase
LPPKHRPKAPSPRVFEAALHRIIGDALLSMQRQGEAEVEFTRALAIARQQQAKSWELRAAMSMARLWRDQGKVQQARELLTPVYGWFTEGFDTRDLMEAKALLEELAASPFLRRAEDKRTTRRATPRRLPSSSEGSR